MDKRAVLCKGCGAIVGYIYNETMVTTSLPMKKVGATKVYPLIHCDVCGAYTEPERQESAQ